MAKFIFTPWIANEEGMKIIPHLAIINGMCQIIDGLVIMFTFGYIHTCLHLSFSRYTVAKSIEEQKKRRARLLDKNG